MVLNDIFLNDLQISKVELDELWTFVKKTNSVSGRPKKTNHIWSMEELFTFPYFKTSVN